MVRIYENSILFQINVVFLAKNVDLKDFKGLFPYSFYNDYCHFYPSCIETIALF